MLPMRPSWYLAMKGSLSAAYSFFNNLTLQADILYASFKINIFLEKKIDFFQTRSIWHANHMANNNIW